MFTFLKDLRSACFSQVSITHPPEVQTTDRDMTVHCKYTTQHSTLDTQHYLLLQLVPCLSSSFYKVFILFKNVITSDINCLKSRSTFRSSRLIGSALAVTPFWTDRSFRRTTIIGSSTTGSLTCSTDLIFCAVPFDSCTKCKANKETLK